MPQMTFNMCAVTVAKLSAYTGKDVEDIAHDIADNYASTYQDTRLEQDIATAASMLLDLFRVFVKDLTDQNAVQKDMLVSALQQMQFCIVRYHTNGKRRRRKIFRGAWFVKEPEQLEDKVKKCMANITTYHILVIADRIPIMPNGWHLRKFRR